MTDCTLDQYYGITEEELGPILQAETRKMFNSGYFENDSDELVNNFYLTSKKKHETTALIFRYWERMKIFTCLPITLFQKRFQT